MEKPPVLEPLPGLTLPPAMDAVSVVLLYLCLDVNDCRLVSADTPSDTEVEDDSSPSTKYFGPTGRSYD